MTTEDTVNIFDNEHVSQKGRSLDERFAEMFGQDLSKRNESLDDWFERITSGESDLKSEMLNNTSLDERTVDGVLDYLMEPDEMSDTRRASLFEEVPDNLGEQMDVGDADSAADLMRALGLEAEDD